jgi:hypothetical protein
MQYFSNFSLNPSGALSSLLHSLFCFLFYEIVANALFWCYVLPMYRKSLGFFFLKKRENLMGFVSI